MDRRVVNLNDLSLEESHKLLDIVSILGGDIDEDVFFVKDPKKTSVLFNDLFKSQSPFLPNQNVLFRGKLAFSIIDSICVYLFVFEREDNLDV